MCRVIAVANQKGGVGKTVTCVNLGIGLAREGQRVLLIDSDPQGSLTISLGCDEPDKLDGTLASILLKVVNDEEVSPKENIRSHTEGVDYLAGNIELSDLEISLNGVISRETILRSYVEKMKEMYDYIIIDCMPSLGLLTINALACADSVLIPVQAAYLPVKGLQQLIKTIGRAKKQLNPKLRIEGILLTMDAMKRQGYRRDLTSSTEWTKLNSEETSSEETKSDGTKYRSGDVVGKGEGIAKSMVHKYIRLTELINPLLKMVDEKRLAIAVGVELSYLNKNMQQWAYEYIRENGMIRQEQLMVLRNYRGDQVMNQEQFIDLMIGSAATFPTSKKITFTERKLKKYFPADYSKAQMERVIISLLTTWKQSQEDADNEQ